MAPEGFSRASLDNTADQLDQVEGQLLGTTDPEKLAELSTERTSLKDQKDELVNQAWDEALQEEKQVEQRNFDKQRIEDLKKALGITHDGVSNEIQGEQEPAETIVERAISSAQTNAQAEHMMGVAPGNDDLEDLLSDENIERIKKQKEDQELDELFDFVVKNREGGTSQEQAQGQKVGQETASIPTGSHEALRQDPEQVAKEAIQSARENAEKGKRIENIVKDVIGEDYQTKKTWRWPGWDPHLSASGNIQEFAHKQRIDREDKPKNIFFNGVMGSGVSLTAGFLAGIPQLSFGPMAILAGAGVGAGFLAAGALGFAGMKFYNRYKDRKNRAAYQKILEAENGRPLSENEVNYNYYHAYER